MSENFKGLGRQSFIDFARGLVMLVMAWDHVSSFWHILHHGGEGVLGQMPPYASTLWFLERFVSHFCAPTFIFLAGTALALSTVSRLERGVSQRDISFHIIIRGVVLLVLEAYLVAPAFDLPPYYFGVIACIGVCFILFSVIRFVPRNIIFVLSLFTVLFHGSLSLEWIPMTSVANAYLRVILLEPNFNSWPYVGLYSLIPWIGVMGLGWVFGGIVRQLYVPFSKLRYSLVLTGVSSIGLFFVVRSLRSSGNLLPRRGGTIIDWLYVSKYPPSVAFLLWGLGGMCLFLAIGLWVQEREIKNPLSEALQDIGKTPLFFYIAHLWLFRLRMPFTDPPFYLEMYQTFIFWVIGNVILWQLCKRYYQFKRDYQNSPLKYI
jgi:uncharacterized membrane protein